MCLENLGKTTHGFLTLLLQQFKSQLFFCTPRAWSEACESCGLGLGLGLGLLVSRVFIGFQTRSRDENGDAIGLLTYALLMF